ncbi:MAG: hypothetical protein Tsb0010_06220 [Parvularculaceae bacterium]
MRENGDEFDCKVTNISPGGLFAASAAAVDENENIVIYIEELHRFEGRVARIRENGFGLEFRASARKIERTANALTLLANKHLDSDLALECSVSGEAPSHILVSTADGQSAKAKVIELWISGVRVAARLKPAIGSVAKVGRTAGRVSEVHADGFSIEFPGSSSGASV